MQGFLLQHDLHGKAAVRILYFGAVLNPGSASGKVPGLDSKLDTASLSAEVHRNLYFSVKSISKISSVTLVITQSLRIASP